MTSYITHDSIVEELAQLPLLAPDHAWTDRVRTRCRTQLSRRQTRPARTEMIAGFGRRVFAPVAVGCFCVLYVAALVATTFRLHGVFH